MCNGGKLATKKKQIDTKFVTDTYLFFLTSDYVVIVTCFSQL